MSHLVVTNDTTTQSPEDRILDAARRCVDRWGINKLTIDDVAAERAASFLLHAERESLRRALPLSSILSPAWRGELGPTAHGPKPMLSAAVLGGRH